MGSGINVGEGTLMNQMHMIRCVMLVQRAFDQKHLDGHLFIGGTLLRELVNSSSMRDGLRQ